MTVKKIRAWSAGVVAAFVVFGLAFKFVPDYIAGQVRAHFANELELHGITNAEQASTTNTAQLAAVLQRFDALEARLILRDQSVDVRMLARDQFIMDYFRDMSNNRAGSTGGSE